MQTNTASEYFFKSNPTNRGKYLNRNWSLFHDHNGNNNNNTKPLLSLSLNPPVIGRHLHNHFSRPHVAPRLLKLTVVRTNSNTAPTTATAGANFNRTDVMLARSLWSTSPPACLFVRCMNVLVRCLRVFICRRWSSSSPSLLASRYWLI